MSQVQPLTFEHLREVRMKYDQLLVKHAREVRLEKNLVDLL